MINESKIHHNYNGLRKLISYLRGPDGCTWDGEQTATTLSPLLLEECYELMDAISNNDMNAMVEELGDVLFLILFQIQIVEELEMFQHNEVLSSLILKLIRRHPHIFEKPEKLQASQEEERWNTIKQFEKEDRGLSVLDGIPTSLPALSHASLIQKRASLSNFDWENIDGVLDKVSEELRELNNSQSSSEKEREFGDILFTIVNVARWMGIDPEGALRQTNQRFYDRFQIVERIARDRNLKFSRLCPKDKESLWEDAKEQHILRDSE